MIIATFMLSACDPDKMQLYINAKAGDKYHYNVTMKQISKTSVSEYETSISQKVAFDFSIRVDDVKSNGDLDLTYTYDRIRLKMDLDDLEYYFDSDSNNYDDIGELYENIVGKQFNIRMTKSGKIKEVKGLDEFLGSLTGPLKANGNEDIFGLDFLNQLENTLLEGFGENTIKNDIGQLTNYLPDKKVNVGDTWTVKEKIDQLNMKIETETTYSFDRLENGIAYISVTGTYKTKDPLSASNNGLKMNTYMEGNIEGNIQANTENGFIVNGEMRQNIKGHMKFEGIDIDLSALGLDMGNLEFPIESTSVITFSSEKVN
jgi:hypothetical protein